MKFKRRVARYPDNKYATRYTCPACGKEYDSFRSRRLHMEKKHPNYRWNVPEPERDDLLKGKDE